MPRNHYLSGPKIKALKLKKALKVVDLVDDYFQAYTAARLNEACRLFAGKMLNPKRGVTIGLTLAGALTPAGLGGIIVSMMQKGFIDYIISTGANLYHDLHFALNYDLHRGDFQVEDKALWEQNIIRIYDIFIDEKVLLKTDDLFLRKFILKEIKTNHPISTSQFHHILGKTLLKKSPNPESSILAQAAKLNIPVFAPAFADSTIAQNIIALHQFLDKRGADLKIEPLLDILELASYVMSSKESGGILVGGGVPKNFFNESQCFLSSFMGFKEFDGHDYFIQITTDSPQWGGLSGATPQEAVTWGKINPQELKQTVVVYADATVALPILFAYAQSKAKQRRQKNLILKREKLLNRLKKRYLETGGINLSTICK